METYWAVASQKGRQEMRETKAFCVHGVTTRMHGKRVIYDVVGHGRRQVAVVTRPDRGDGLAHVARVIARFHLSLLVSTSSLCLPWSLLSHCSLDLPFAFIFLCSLLHANLRLYVAQILSLCCLLSRFTKRFLSAQHVRAGRPCGAREVECHGS